MQRAVCLTCSTEPKYVLAAERARGKPPAPVILSRNKGEIPLWYKRAGIYSPLPPPLTCDSKLNPWSANLLATRAPIALSDRKDRVVVPLKALRSLDSSVPGGGAAPWFFMWAARPRRLAETRVRGPEESYGDFSNCAVAQADPKTDSVTFEFASPVPYAVDGVPYPPHIHFTRLLSDDIWDTRIWSMNVPPMMSRQETARCIRSSDYLVLNALPVHALQGQHIPGTARLPYELTLSSIGRLLHSRVKNDTPLVLYCAGPRCNASHVLMEKLLALGYTNLLLYPGGLEEWGGKST